MGDSSLKPEGDYSFADLNPTVEQESLSWYKTWSQKTCFSQEKDGVQDRGKTFARDSSFRDSYIQKNDEVENEAEQHNEQPDCFSSRNIGNEQENTSFSTATGAGIMGDTSLKPERYNSFANLNPTFNQECLSWCKTWSQKTRCSQKKDGFQDRGKTFARDSSFCDANTQKNAVVENEAEQHKGQPNHFCSRSVDGEKENLSSSTDGAGIMGDASLKCEGVDSFADLNQTVEQESPSWYKTWSQKTRLSQKKDGVQDRWKKFARDSSFCDTYTQKSIRVENEAEHKEQLDHFSSRNLDDELENLSSSTTTGAGIMGDTSLKPERDDSFADLNPTVEQESPSWYKPCSQKTHFSQKKDGVQDRGKTFATDSSFPDTYKKKNVEVENETEEQKEKPDHFSSRDVDEEKEKLFSSTETGAGIMGATSLKPEGYNPFADLNPTVEQESPSWYKLWSQKTRCSQRKDGVQDRGKTFARDSSFCDTEWQSDTHINHGRASFRDKERKVSGKPSLRSTQEQVQKQFDYAGACFQDKEETQFNNGRSFSKNEGESILESVSNAEPRDEKNPLLPAHDGNGTPNVQTFIIFDREMFKETNEYKIAAEQEWASRLRELQIQAEEAKRLKKRKKAEAVRLLDMERRQKQRVKEIQDTQKKAEEAQRLKKRKKAEAMRLSDMKRRQKQRVEEIREMQRKDMETTNLKEQLRIEISKDLDRLERKNKDTASLLRGLGIHVGGGLHPLPHELSAASKQALLRFHPDRVSRTDIRQQVEAEEKFKLISRLKEKYLGAS